MLQQKTTGYLLLAWFGLCFLALPLGLFLNQQPEANRISTKKGVTARPAKNSSQAGVTGKQIASNTPKVNITKQPAAGVPVVVTQKPLPATNTKSFQVANNIWKPTAKAVKAKSQNGTLKNQSPKAVSTYQYQMLARIISAEAKGEPFHGQVAVGAVILNRIDSGRFPKTIAANVLKRGQFEPVANGSIWNKPAASAYRAARLALKGWDPTGGALYFFNPAKTSSRWIWSRPIVKRIGDHVFAV